MANQSVTPAQYRALEAADAGHIAKMDGVPGWLVSPGCARPPRQDVLDRIDAIGLLQQGLRFKTLNITRYEPSDVGQQVLDGAKRGEGS